tara:strand:+ start:266 stop:580 length:315 start_codon:yes stop_codon:yes gene_type:complete
MIYDIRVTHRDQSDPYFQTYIETVEAATSQDAVSRVQRKNPGHLVQCEGSYNRGGSDSSAGDAMGWLIIMGFVFGLWLLIEYWFIAVPVLAFIVIAMVWQQFTD